MGHTPNYMKPPEIPAVERRRAPALAFIFTTLAIVTSLVGIVWVAGSIH